MVETGEHQRLGDTRLFFQYATDDRFRAAVEGVTGRKVRAFISGLDTVQDVSSEVFYFGAAPHRGARSSVARFN